MTETFRNVKQSHLAVSYKSNVNHTQIEKLDFRECFFRTKKQDFELVYFVPVHDRVVPQQVYFVPVHDRVVQDTKVFRNVGTGTGTLLIPVP